MTVLAFFRGLAQSTAGRLGGGVVFKLSECGKHLFKRTQGSCGFKLGLPGVQRGFPVWGRVLISTSHSSLLLPLPLPTSWPPSTMTHISKNWGSCWMRKGIVVVGNFDFTFKIFLIIKKLIMCMLKKLKWLKNYLQWKLLCLSLRPCDSSSLPPGDWLHRPVTQTPCSRELSAWFDALVSWNPQQFWNRDPMFHFCMGTPTNDVVSPALTDQCWQFLVWPSGNFICIFIMYIIYVL